MISEKLYLLIENYHPPLVFRSRELAEKAMNNSIAEYANLKLYGYEHCISKVRTKLEGVIREYYLFENDDPKPYATITLYETEIER